MSLRVYISEFPEYDVFPSKGSHSYTDSRVFELEFNIDSIEYFVKFHISIKYNRWFYPETREEPVEDDFEITESDIEIFKIYKYVNGDEIELKDKEFIKIEKYIIENLEIC